MSMNEIKLWQINGSSNVQNPEELEVVRNAQTEYLLEDALVKNPRILEQGLTLIGRQLPTANGPLDLLGVDRDGRIVIFELKRGELTRDAVAQVLDYASDINLMDREELLRHIEGRSGQGGIDKIDDLEELYESDDHRNIDNLSKTPRIVLVGLGVDSRAKRIVNYLASLGMDIDLLIFAAFNCNGSLLLARQVEVKADEVRPASKSDNWTQSAIEKSMTAKASSLGVQPLVEEMRDFVTKHLRVNKGYPKKSGVTYYLPGVFDEPPTNAWKAYASLTMNGDFGRAVELYLNVRALKAGGVAVEEFLRRFNAEKRQHFRMSFDLWAIMITQESWVGIRDELATALSAVADGVERRSIELSKSIEMESD